MMTSSTMRERAIRGQERVYGFMLARLKDTVRRAPKMASMAREAAEVARQLARLEGYTPTGSTWQDKADHLERLASTLEALS